MVRLLLALLLSSVLIFSCGGTSGSVAFDNSNSGNTSGATGTITFEATDKPFDFALLESAIIRVDRLAVKLDGFDDEDDDYNDSDDDSSSSSFSSKSNPKSGDDDDDDDDDDDSNSGFIELKLDETIEFDLVELRNGLTHFMLADSLPEGEIRQLRLYITRAEIVLTNGNVYNIMDGTLKVKGLLKSGFKVFIDPPIRVEADTMTKVLLDFDLSKTFKAIPANDPANAKFFMFHPVIRAVDKAMCGTLRGTVQQDDEDGNRMDVENAMIHVLNQGETDIDQSVATTLSEADGSFAVLGLDPGLYDVLGTTDSANGRVDAVTITKGETTSIELVLE